MVLRRHRILASAQIREIGRDPCVVLGTEKVHPTELWAGPEWVGGLWTLHTSLLLYTPWSPVDDTELRADCLHNWH